MTATAGAGPGKYGPAIELAMAATGAQTALLIVFGGVHGEGFEVATRNPASLSDLPTWLRSIANQIEAAAGSKS